MLAVENAPKSLGLLSKETMETGRIASMRALALGPATRAEATNSDIRTVEAAGMSTSR